MQSKKKQIPQKTVNLWKRILLSFLGAFCLLLIFLYLFFLYQRNSWTEKAPLLPLTDSGPVLSSAESEKMVRDLKNIFDSSFSQQRTYDNRQFKELLSLIPAYAEQRERISLELKGDKILANCSLSLQNIPGFKGRYLNGEFLIDASIENANLQLELCSAQAKGKKVPEKVLFYLNQELKKELEKEWRKNSDLQKIASLQIKNDKLTFKTIGK